MFKIGDNVLDKNERRVEIGTLSEVQSKSACVEESKKDNPEKVGLRYLCAVEKDGQMLKYYRNGTGYAVSYYSDKERRRKMFYGLWLQHLPEMFFLKEFERYLKSRGYMSEEFYNGRRTNIEGLL